MTDRQEVPLTGLIWRLSMRWRASIDRAIAPLGLTHAQYSVLAPLVSLGREGRHPNQRELADFTGLEALYVSKLARSLEAAGLLRRDDHPSDSRAVQLVLTDSGREVAAAAVEQVVAMQAELTTALGSPDGPRTRDLRQSLQLLLGASSPPTEGPTTPQ